MIVICAGRFVRLFDKNVLLSSINFPVVLGGLLRSL
jgi:hypothetical protein